MTLSVCTHEKTDAKQMEKSMGKKFKKLFTGQEVQIRKTCARGLEKADLGLTVSVRILKTFYFTNIFLFFVYWVVTHLQHEEKAVLPQVPLLAVRCTGMMTSANKTPFPLLLLQCLLFHRICLHTCV